MTRRGSVPVLKLRIPRPSSPDAMFSSARAAFGLGAASSSRSSRRGAAFGSSGSKGFGSMLEAEISGCMRGVPWGGGVFCESGQGARRSLPVRRNEFLMPCACSCGPNRSETCGDCKRKRRRRETRSARQRTAIAALPKEGASYSGMRSPKGVPRPYALAPSPTRDVSTRPPPPP